MPTHDKLVVGSTWASAVIRRIYEQAAAALCRRVMFTIMAMAATPRPRSDTCTASQASSESNGGHMYSRGKCVAAAGCLP